MRGSKVWAIEESDIMCLFIYSRGLIVFLSLLLTTSAAKITTETRIQALGYPVESHNVQTKDGYILQMFRIPYAKSNQNVTSSKRPIALLLHGILSSSDGWVISDANDSLAFALSNAGYDVWLGNCRGNTYSRKHVSYKPYFQRFWNFEWHHMGIYDLPAMIDYALNATGQESLHVLAHSQGTTALLVLLSMVPAYNSKIKTAQLLAPVAYMTHIKTPIAKIIAPFLGRPNALVEVFGSAEFMPDSFVNRLLGAQACKDSSPVQAVCSNSLFLICGFNSANMNKTLLPEIMRTHPAGISVNQFMHFLQEKRSGEFRQFDYGLIRNKFKYKQISPPRYQLSRIRAPLYLYYSDNDWLSSVQDVELLAGKLPNVRLAYRHPDKKWNHLDFLWAIGVTEKLYKHVIENMSTHLI